MNRIMNSGQQHYTKSNMVSEKVYYVIRLYKAYWKGKFTWMKPITGFHRGKYLTKFVYKESHYRYEIPSNWFMLTSDFETKKNLKEAIWNWRTVSNIKHSSLKLSLQEKSEEYKTLQTMATIIK